MSEDPSAVSYTVKELIGRLDSKLDLLLNAVDSKASVGALDRLDAKVGELTGRTTVLESDAATAKAVSVNTRWLLFSAVPTSIALAVTLSKLL